MPQSTASDRSSRVSHSSAVSTPAWPPPRAPLMPHRLAKFANALGVPTPLPAIHAYAPSQLVSIPDARRRPRSHQPRHTRFLLHRLPRGISMPSRLRTFPMGPTRRTVT
ncbi:hypothetical protein OBBRIDRAFT_798663 [Obba rivulosa]|uniref:Uncharacterized protein n=1 Tax=Obba rivulosa TaxID=1052685 RepID=A0A8E2AI79_9APHY|nr:hypothetical protein OBBRIDRAFT_798663 [Obba rivulosa]